MGGARGTGPGVCVEGVVWKARLSEPHRYSVLLSVTPQGHLSSPRNGPTWASLPYSAFGGSHL